jgi:hypothetical protein
MSVIVVETEDNRIFITSKKNLDLLLVDLRKAGEKIEGVTKYPDGFEFVTRHYFTDFSSKDPEDLTELYR